MDYPFAKFGLLETDPKQALDLLLAKMAGQDDWQNRHESLGIVRDFIRLYFTAKEDAEIDRIEKNVAEKLRRRQEGTGL